MGKLQNPKGARERSTSKASHVPLGCDYTIPSRAQVQGGSKAKMLKEIKEMLLVIYPTSAKPIDESSYAFLLDLAKEYMMSEKCENYLISRLSTSDYCYTTCACGNRRPGRQYVNKGNCLELLVIAQNYGLNRLECECVERAKDIQFSELKKDNNFDKISAANYRQIVEGMLQGQPF